MKEVCEKQLGWCWWAEGLFLICLQDKIVFVCSADCSMEYKKANFVTSLCEYCKIEKITREVKRIDNKDCYFCSDGTRLFRGICWSDRLSAQTLVGSDITSCLQAAGSSSDTSWVRTGANTATPAFTATACPRSWWRLSTGAPSRTSAPRSAAPNTPCSSAT